MTHAAVKVKNLRWWDWLAALLLLAALSSSAARLVATRWTENLGLTMSVVVLGAVLGLMLGQSIFRRGVSFFFTLAYGVIIIPWQLGMALGEHINWVERLTSIGGRLEIVVQELFRRDPVSDNLLFLVLMTCLYWFLSVHAGYTLTRHGDPWLATLPGGLVAFVVHSFDPLLFRRSWYLAFYLLFALMVVARIAFLKKHQLWVQTRTHTPLDVGFDWGRVALLVALGCVVFSWNVPVFADSLRPAAEIWQVASQPWLSLKERFGFAFAALQASVGLVSDMYGDNMVLGRGNPLSDRVMFNVEAPIAPVSGVRYYWRARVYGLYEAGQWKSSLVETRPVSGNSLDLNQPGIEMRTTAMFTFYPFDVISVIFTVPQPLWISRPAEAKLANNEDGTVDLGLFEADPYIRPGDRYQVRAALSSVTVAELRAAGSDYPDWVIDRYLQLPEEITPRTRQLAQQIAAGLDNPYDIADAVTNYLRNNIEYTDFVPDLPSGQERVDWFLFDLRQGFCNYYATAEVVLLRSLGIPARIAVGFAQGERQTEIVRVITPGADEGPIPPSSGSDIATFIVRQRDAHAWPEVYFPGIGWVEFEPTTAQLPLFRLQGLELEDNPPPNERPRPGEDEQSELPEDAYPAPEDDATSAQGPVWTPRRVALVALLIASAALLAFIVWKVRRGFRVSPALQGWAMRIPGQIERGLLRLGVQPPAFIRLWTQYAALPPLTRAYLEINRALKRLHQSPALQDTPAERVAALSANLPPAADPAGRLLAQYHAAAYSQHPADLALAQQAGQEVRKLSYLAILNRWLARFQEPPRRPNKLVE